MPIAAALSHQRLDGTLQGQPLAPPDYSVLELYKRSAEFLKAFSAV